MRAKSFFYVSLGILALVVPAYAQTGCPPQAVYRSADLGGTLSGAEYLWFSQPVPLDPDLGGGTSIVSNDGVLRLSCGVTNFSTVSDTRDASGTGVRTLSTQYSGACLRLQLPNYIAMDGSFNGTWTVTQTFADNVMVSAAQQVACSGHVTEFAPGAPTCDFTLTADGQEGARWYDTWPASMQPPLPCINGFAHDCCGEFFAQDPSSGTCGELGHITLTFGLPTPTSQHTWGQLKLRYR